MTLRHLARCIALALGAWACALGTGGCQAVGLVSVMAESYKRTGTHSIKAEYTGLTDKSFAVVVAADRALQADQPALVPGLTIAISERIAQAAGASGYVPPDVMIEYMSSNPRWAVMSPTELAKDLGVDRLVHVDLVEFRLHEPGDATLWSGLASAHLGVLEADGAIPDEFMFRKDVTVRFPDKDGESRADTQEQIVRARLQTRLVDRVVWNFFEHEEPYYPKY